MSSSYGVIPRSNTSFSNLPPLPGAVAAASRRCVSFQTQSRLPTIRAAIDDGNYAGFPSISHLDKMSFYERLGISEKGSFGEIKQAYKQLARKYHPDVSPPDRVEENTQLFIRVQEAYETLSDPEQRAIYDMDMTGGIHKAFSARKIYRSREVVRLHKSEWKARWQSQVSELKRRTEMGDDPKNMSWAAQMRRQRKKKQEEEMLSGILNVEIS